MPHSTTLPAPSKRALPSLDVVLALGALYLIWGSTYLAIKLAVEAFPPYLMQGARFLAAGGILYLYLRARGVPNPTRAQWFGALRVGTLLLVAGVGGVTLVESWGVSSGMAAVVVATMPLWLVFFMWFWGETTTRWEVMGLALGLFGVLLLNLDQGLRANPLAALILFLSPVCWAFGSAWSRSLPQTPGLMASATQMLSASAVFALIALLRGERVTAVPTLEASLALVYLIFIGSLVGYSAYIYLLNQRVRPVLLSSYAYVNPVVAVILGIIVVGETVSVAVLVGMTVILVSIVVTVTAKAWSARPKPAASSD
jgi:drug/metabolite transporter (DMT)-like permease